ncbi:predicted protein [Enterococcus faecium 1,141,733]|nr:predicted protein [Enterococcus faecium 1,141,733]
MRAESFLNKMDAYQTGTLDTQETPVIDTLFNISHAIEVIDHFNLNDSENLSTSDRYCGCHQDD